MPGSFAHVLTWGGVARTRGISDFLPGDSAVTPTQGTNGREGGGVVADRGRHHFSSTDFVAGPDAATAVTASSNCAKLLVIQLRTGLSYLL